MAEQRITASTGNATAVLTWNEKATEVDLQRLLVHLADEWARKAGKKP